MLLGQNSNEAVLVNIGEGRHGTIQTLRVMTAYVRQFKKDPQIRRKAIELTSHLPQKDFAGEIAALFVYVRDSIRYVQDVTDVETLHTPPDVLRIGAGDCDDKSVLLASLLESIGHPTRFKAIGFAPGDYQHVYVQTRLGAPWVSLDATEMHGVGWEPRSFTDFILSHN